MRVLLYVVAIALVTMGVAGLLSGYMHDRYAVACYDAGRVVGGAEQRIFFAKADGDEPLPRDIGIAAKGAVKECR